MSGYKVTDEDVEQLVSWLSRHDPENANEEFATEMLLYLKMTLREIGNKQPDDIETLHKRFLDSKTN